MKSLTKAFAGCAALITANLAFTGAAHAEQPLGQCDMQPYAAFETNQGTKAFGDDGCVYGVVGGRLLPLNNYDLYDQREAQRYYQQFNAAQQQQDAIYNRRQNQYQRSYGPNYGGSDYGKGYNRDYRDYRGYGGRRGNRRYDRVPQQRYYGPNRYQQQHERARQRQCDRAVGNIVNGLIRNGDVRDRDVVRTLNCF